MKNRRVLTFVSSCVLIMSVATTIAVSSKSIKSDISFATYTNGDAATYYNEISNTLTGSDLLTALNTLNKSRKKSEVGYSPMGTTPTGQFKYTDYDPNYVQYDSNHQPYGTQISSFYTYTPATSWNREHVWPKSRGGDLVDADIHMTRPTIASENSSRGNSYYVEGMNNNANGWDPKTAGYNELSRGEAARIIFYCAIANTTLSLECANTSATSTKRMGNLETLLKWNLEYSVTQREKNRNEGAEYLQGNRNPFIDHPEYGCKIWGNTNARTKEICSGSQAEHGSVPNDPFTVKEAIEKAKEFVDANSPTYYTKGFISQIKSFDAEFGNAEFYISADGTTSGDQLLIYRGAYLGGEKIQSEDQIAPGTKVLISGQLTYFKNNTPEYIQGSYIYAKGSDVDDIAPDPEGPSLLNISLSGNYKKVFILGEQFNYDGLIVTANYTSGPSKVVQPTSVSTPDMSTVGTKEVTVSYTENEISKEAKYSINVSPVTLSKIEISKQPNKTEFEVGEEFTYEGLEITAYYSNGTSKVVESTNVVAPDMTTEGSKNVKVEYTENGKTVLKYYQILVKAKAEPTPEPTPTPIPIPTPTVTPTPEPEPTPAPSKKGCGGSIVAGSIIISITSLLGVGLLLIKKKH